MKNIKLFALLIILTSCGEPDLNLDDALNPNIGLEVDLVGTFGGNGNDIGTSITSTNDGGYAILGYTNSTDGDITTKTTDDFDFLLLKYNSQDILEWSKTYGGSDDDRGNQILQTTDSGYVIFGFSNSSDKDVSENNGNSDFWVSKLNSNGDISWQKSFGFSGRDYGTSLTATSDGGLLLVGELDVTSSGGEGNFPAKSVLHAGGDFWSVKIDANGNREWSKFFGGNFTDTPQGVIQLDDGSYVITGFSDSSDVDITNNKGTYDFWVLKISNTGTILWEKNFGGSEIDESFDIKKTEDGNIIIIGDTRSSDKDVTKNNGGADLWVIKITPDGDLMWQKNFGGTNFDTGRAIKNTTDGGFVICGSSRSSDRDFINKGQNDAWVIKISSTGSVQWQKFVGGTDIDILHDVVELSNGTFIAVGESTSQDEDIEQNKGFSDLLKIKIK
ncbi:hypothetical protein BTO06_18245 [Tenacibaculum sp. SZ-18]|uniref:hypothetical protein n=1 Tax=Tenacibaculum sp. SZ-18 TaxID=754423 RepID=UPI000C2D658C|nr:hypothetical protein [Tenacibaculum sp. SZ-18]AUC16969.1 hypothetical protein BTO06_18245 [Tenacibaculum sp. SZ-18]